MELFPPPPQYNTQQQRYQPCLLYIISGKSNYKLTNSHSSPIIPQHISQPKFSGNSKQIPNWSFLGKQLFQPQTEIETETIPFENNFNLQNTHESSIKLPPITISNFNGNPLRYHECINNFFSLVHNNTSFMDTHRIKYLQNSVVGKTKEKF